MQKFTRKACPQPAPPPPSPLPLIKRRKKSVPVPRRRLWPGYTTVSFDSDRMSCPPSLQIPYDICYMCIKWKVTLFWPKIILTWLHSPFRLQEVVLPINVHLLGDLIYTEEIGVAYRVAPYTTKVTVNIHQSQSHQQLNSVVTGF